MVESDADHVLLDVRTPGKYDGKSGPLWFYERGQKEDAHLIPDEELDSRIDELAP